MKELGSLLAFLADSIPTKKGVEFSYPTSDLFALGPATKTTNPLLHINGLWCHGRDINFAIVEASGCKY
jgi:hypothetical protein